MSCPDCFRGHIQSGKPRGEIIKLNGLETYVAKPTADRPAKGVIVIIPDAFGLAFINNQLLADHYAEKGGYRVYLPEFMNGYAAPVWSINSMNKLTGPGNYLWKPYYFFWTAYALLPFWWVNRPGKACPRVKPFFEWLRRQEALPIYVAGFCWGGKILCVLGAPGNEVDGRPLFDAGFTGHPSLLTLPDDVENLVVPTSFAIGDRDNYVSVEQCGHLKGILEKKPDGQKGELKVYIGAGHGFCIRIDNRDEDVSRQAAEAEDQCIEWFDSQLQQG